VRDIYKLLYKNQLYVFVWNAFVYMEGIGPEDQVPMACMLMCPVWEGAVSNTFPCFLTDLGEIRHKRSLRIAVG